MKYTPHPYQRKAIKFMIQRACAGLFLDPGLGKTSITLAAFKLLKSQGLIEKMLVIAPLRPAYSVWPGEVARWDEFQHLKVAVLHGPKKLEALRSDADIMVINPEGLPWLFEELIGKEFPWQMLVVDESTRFKHGNTQRFKTLRPQLPKFKRRYILTGSPAPNGLLDLFGQVFILDLGNSLGRYVTHYRSQFFDSAGYGGYQWVPRADSAERIYKKLQPLTLRMAAEDYLDLPPLIENVVEIDLPDEARRQYAQMEGLLLADIDGGVVTAANAAAASMKCRQIVNGGLYINEEHDFKHIHRAKAEAVAEIVEELSGKPALVAYEFRHDLERLREFFPDAPHIGGGVTPKQFKQIETDWNAGRIPVLLAQPQSVAHGLNLQGTGAAVIWHSLPWDLEIYDQFIRRVYRQGQKESIVNHKIVCRKTIDAAIVRMLGRKDKVQRDLLGALRDYRRAA